MIGQIIIFIALIVGFEETEHPKNPLLHFLQNAQVLQSIEPFHIQGKILMFLKNLLYHFEHINRSKSDRRSHI